jgi:hypothetical protein
VTTNISFISDFFNLLFSPKRFFAERFLAVSSRRIFVMGFLGTFIGLIVGSTLAIFFSDSVMTDLIKNKENYTSAIQALGLNETSFLDLMKAQKAYSMLIAILSPLIAYMASHIFGGALFIFLWLLVRPQDNTMNFARVLECASVSLTSMAFYVVPVVGPMIAIIMVGLNVSRALFQHYKLVGFMKVMSVFSALYISFFLTSATLQILAQAFAHVLKG